MEKGKIVNPQFQGGLDKLEKVQTHRIKNDYPLKISNSRLKSELLLCYTDNDTGTEIEKPLSCEHLRFLDILDAYCERNQKGGITNFVLDSITREFYGLKGKKTKPTDNQLGYVRDIIETLRHTHIITREPNEATTRVILYIQVTIKKVQGQICTTYEMQGYSGIRDYASRNHITYTSIPYEYVKLPKGISATTVNVIMQYMILQAVNEQKEELFLSPIYEETEITDNKSARYKLKQRIPIVLDTFKKNGQLKEYTNKAECDSCEGDAFDGYDLYY